MAEKTPKEILDDLQAAQKEAKKAGLIDQREKTDAVIGEAVDAQSKENTGAAADYNNYQKNNAGKSETSGMYAYNAYRSRLAAAAKAAQDAKEKADLSYNMTEANAKANLKNAQAAEQATRNDQHWQQKQWDYQLAVDEAERVAREEAERAAEEAAKQGSSRSYSYVRSGGSDPEEDPTKALYKQLQAEYSKYPHGIPTKVQERFLQQAIQEGWSKEEIEALKAELDRQNIKRGRKKTTPLN